MKISFHFSGIDVQECSCRAIWQFVLAALVFEETAKLFRRVAAPFYIPTSDVWSSFSLPTLGVVSFFFFFFNVYHSDSCVGISHCLNLHFLNG